MLCITSILLMCLGIQSIRDSTSTIAQRSMLEANTRRNSPDIGFDLAHRVSSSYATITPCYLHHLSKLVVSSPVHDRRHPYPDNHIPFLFPIMCCLSFRWYWSWHGFFRGKTALEICTDGVNQFKCYWPYFAELLCKLFPSNRTKYP